MFPSKIEGICFIYTHYERAAWKISRPQILLHSIDPHSWICRKHRSPILKWIEWVGDEVWYRVWLAVQSKVSNINIMGWLWHAITVNINFQRRERFSVYLEILWWMWKVPLNEIVYHTMQMDSSQQLTSHTEFEWPISHFICPKIATEMNVERKTTSVYAHIIRWFRAGTFLRLIKWNLPLRGKWNHRF